MTDEVVPDREPARPPGPSRAVALTALALLSSLFLGLGLVQAWRDAPTYDEPVSLAAGLTAVTRHDLRLNTEHPPLAKALAALPALFAHPDIPDEAGWDEAHENRFTTAFVAANDRDGTLRSTVFLGRIVPLALAVGTGFALYALGARLGGRTVGLVAGASWLTLPPVLGYGHIAGLDIPFAAGLVVTALLIDRHLANPTMRTAALVGLACGACLLVRTTGVVVLVVALVLVVIAARRAGTRSLRQAGLVLLVSWVTLWGGYRILAPGGSDLGEPEGEEAVAEPGCPVGTRPFVEPLCNSIGQTALDWAPLPAEYKAGLAQQQVLGDASEESFVLGDYSEEPSAGFWPASLAVKLPPTVAALGVIGAIGVTRLDPRTRRRLVAVLAPGLAVALTTVFGARPLGIRYLLPVVAVLLLVGATSVVLARRLRPVALVVAVAMVMQLGFLVSSAPHSLAWVAPPFGHPWRVGADSNVDWGQDWYLLREWSRDRGAWVAWIGPMGRARLPGSRHLLGTPLVSVEGWVAVNATTLTVYAHDELEWLRAYCPVGDLGGSVLLYYFEEPPTWGPPAPDAPAEPCDGDVSVRVA